MLCRTMRSSCLGTRSPCRGSDWTLPRTNIYFSREPTISILCWAVVKIHCWCEAHANGKLTDKTFDLPRAYLHLICLPPFNHPSTRKLSKHSITSIVHICTCTFVLVNLRMTEAMLPNINKLKRSQEVHLSVALLFRYAKLQHRIYVALVYCCCICILLNYRLK